MATQELDMQIILNVAYYHGSNTTITHSRELLFHIYNWRFIAACDSSVSNICPALVPIRCCTLGKPLLGASSPRLTDRRHQLGPRITQYL